MAEYYLREDFAAVDLAQGEGTGKLLAWARAEADRAVSGNIYRSKEGRKTLRLERGGRSFFLKLHTGVGWAEIFKNLLQGRLPVVGPRTSTGRCRRLNVQVWTPWGLRPMPARGETPPRDNR